MVGSAFAVRSGSRPEGFRGPAGTLPGRWAIGRARRVLPPEAAIFRPQVRPAYALRENPAYAHTSRLWARKRRKPPGRAPRDARPGRLYFRGAGPPFNPDAAAVGEEIDHAGGHGRRRDRGPVLGDVHVLAGEGTEAPPTPGANDGAPQPPAALLTMAVDRHGSPRLGLASDIRNTRTAGGIRRPQAREPWDGGKAIGLRSRAMSNDKHAKVRAF